MITSLSIHNYKSLRNVHLDDIPPFCVLVGANASGKSNFADALDFLSLVFRDGLAHAVRTKGGYENICFRRARRSKAGLEFDVSIQYSEPSGKRGAATKYEVKYTFAFKATSEKIAADYVVTKEELTLTLQRRRPSTMRLVRDADGHFSTDASAATLKAFGIPPDPSWFRDILKRGPSSEDELALSRTYIRGFTAVRDLLGSCRVYQISPHMARQTGVPERSPELGPHGENLPAAVDYLKRNEHAAFQELLAHLKHTVPAMEKLETEYVETKQLGLFFKEEGVGRRWFSQDVSDGTLQTVCIFFPLLDSRVSIAVIEEPENSIHPWILKHFVNACKLASEEKQVFITTHSPVVLDEVDSQSLYIVERDGKGQTSILSCASISPEARDVLAEHVLGLGEYWDSGALGGVPRPRVRP